MKRQWRDSRGSSTRRRARRSRRRASRASSAFCGRTLSIFGSHSNMLPTMEYGFFTVYFESVDASGHLFLPLKHGAALPSGCPESVRDVVDKTYVQIDQWVGELVRDLPEHAIVMLVSDHGMATGRRTWTACALRRLPRGRRRFSSRWANARHDDSRCRAHAPSRVRRARSSRHGRQSGSVELRGRVARNASSPLCRRGYVAPPRHRFFGRGLARNARAPTLSRSTWNRPQSLSPSGSLRGRGRLAPASR